MMRMVPVILTVAIALVPGRAAAGYTFEFGSDSNGTITSNFSVTVGQTVNVYVYLAQTGTTTGLSSSGLSSAGVALGFNQSVANVPSTSAITANPAFDANTPSTGTGTAQLKEFQVVSGPVVAPTSGSTANAILLGTFTFTGESAGNTSIVTSVPSSTTDSNVLGNGTGIDSLIQNSNAVIAVTAVVPEPSTLALSGLGALALGASAWRRWRRPAPKA